MDLLFKSHVKQYLKAIPQSVCDGLCLNGGICLNRSCNCTAGYFGLWCQNRIYGFNKNDTFFQDITLDPYQAFYFYENYNNGEPGTTIELKTNSQPLMTMVLNQRKDTSLTYFTQELNLKDSQTSILSSWVGGKENKNFDQEQDNLYIELINLSRDSVLIKVNISSSRQ